MSENFEKDVPKRKTQDAPLKFEKMSNSNLEQAESKLFDGLNTIDNDMRKKYENLPKSSFKDKAVKELMNDYMQQVSQLSKQFSEDEFRALMRSGKYEDTDDRIIRNALSVFDFDDATLTFTFAIGESKKGTNGLFPIVRLQKPKEKDEPPVKYY